MKTSCCGEQLCLDPKSGAKKCSGCGRVYSLAPEDWEPPKDEAAFSTEMTATEVKTLHCFLQNNAAASEKSDELDSVCDKVEELYDFVKRRETKLKNCRRKYGTSRHQSS